MADDPELEAIAEHDGTHGPTEGEIMSAEPAEPPGREPVMITTWLRLPKPVMDEVRRRARERVTEPGALLREWVEAAVVDPGGTVPVSVIIAAVARHHRERAALIGRQFERARHWEGVEIAAYVHRADEAEPR
ncbi:hypothetical protein ACFVXG_42755 [Kitasatospora sp. NPDC058162]|uniref:hypothetical protein n=1 Tax=Kitasatospora sp. NPDC058162 TaxID=3346362 RepID=UPI0036DF1EAB